MACVHRLFERWAEQAPEAVAVVRGDDRIGYRELDEWANHIAHRLRAEGVRPGMSVAVCVERSIGLIASLLGVLKAGAVYVPVDPDYPAERQAFILADSGAAVVLTSDSVRPRLRDGLTVPRGASPAGPDLVDVPDAPAYVIYTSGSTGRPKGVVVTHRNVVRLFDVTAGRFGFTSDDVWTMFHSAAFDFSVWEMWGALLHGGRLVVVPRDTARDPDAFWRLLIAEQVTVLNQTPSAFGLLSRAARDAGWPDTALRLVVFGGEALEPATLIPWFDRYGDTSPRLVNMYGITETTVHVTAHALSAGETGSPIGRPLDDLRVRLLDADGSEVPPHHVGEAFVSGPGVSLGYLNRPALTAERFVPDPAGPPGSRRYRSGDLAVADDGGALFYRGRNDSQVQLRGFRIELGEVESALVAIPAVGAAVVVLSDDLPSGPTLVGYLTEAEPADLPDIRAHLRRTLPDHMVPVRWVFLDRLPLTAHGKADRRALPLPAARLDADEPVGATERLIAGIWRDVVGVEPGRHDNLFAMGGSSLHANQILTRIGAALGHRPALGVVFADPTVAGLAAACSEPDSGLLPVARVEPLPLSSAQQRLWLLHKLFPDSCAYHEQFAYVLTGEVDVGLLAGGFAAAARRHDVLRTVFLEQDGTPRQVVTNTARVRVDIGDVAGLDEVRSIADEEARTPFDLGHGPLARVWLLRMPRAVVLLMTMHHIATDEWSLGVLFDELRRHHSSSVPPELPVQYADYAVWQRERPVERHLDFWRELLAEAPGSIGLATDRPRPARRSFAGARHRFVVPPDVAGGLRALAHRTGTTPHMVLLAAYNVLLHRLSGDSDLVVGTPVAGRDHAEVEGLIGFFVNMLPIRTRCTGEITFGELLTRVRDTVTAAYAHQELPFDALVDGLGVDRDPGTHPLFQVVFALRNNVTLDLPGVTAEPVALDPRSAKYDLALFMTDDDALSGDLDYSTELFDATTAARIADRFLALLKGIVVDAGTKVRDYDFVPAVEQDVIRSWQGAEVAIAESNVPELVAAVHPDAVALVDGDVAVRFGDLVGRANRLAWWLRGLGVGRGDVVGLVLPRGVELAVSTLAVLSAGAAYLPMDPGVPVERLRFMVEDADARVVVGLGAPPVDAPWVDLVGDAERIAAQPSTDLGVRCSPEDMAYVIYTSGSTGRPKGVVVPHRGLSNLVSWHVREVGLGSGDRTSLVASPGFDASVWELWPSLVAGASVHVPGEEVRSDPDLLLEWFADNGITAAFVPTPLAEPVFRRSGPSSLSLRVLVTGGDVLTSGPSASYRVLNNYGPTENSVVATACEIQPGAQNFPIGRPIDNVRAYVVDEAGRQVGIGIAGELWIGGTGQALGYLGRAGLTAERFVPDPFGPPGGRLYRTGDRVRWNVDGDLEFLGRLDHQVKVLGHRIELGEIESVLGEHPDVRSAAVVLRSSDNGEPVLTGYVQPVGAALDLDDVRGRLASRLPGYMVPPVLGVVDRWPTTASGKTDRNALPPLELPAGRAVSGPVEETLAAVWAEVLELRAAPDATDNFFGLGGNSLNATRIAARIQDALDVEVAIREVFAAPTIEALARRLGRSHLGIEARAREYLLVAAMDPAELLALAQGNLE
ncbi:amino acid adenylation domain-containing protein [Actinosynnema sp. CS-041913]|uniref:amino acid adenylation domain-containing protein n=1 Tax=Actinosynnema sp. CS-041913 TaxID=3239917 RepID=UPI003D8F7D3E